MKTSSFQNCERSFHTLLSAWKIPSPKINGSYFELPRSWMGPMKDSEHGGWILLSVTDIIRMNSLTVLIHRLFARKSLVPIYWSINQSIDHCSGISVARWVSHRKSELPGRGVRDGLKEGDTFPVGCRCLWNTHSWSRTRSYKENCGSLYILPIKGLFKKINSWKVMTIFFHEM